MADWLQTLLRSVGMGSDEDPYTNTNRLERALGTVNTEKSVVPKKNQPRTEDMWLSSPGVPKPATMRATTPMDTVREVVSGDYLANKAEDVMGSGPIPEMIRLMTPDPTDVAGGPVAGQIYRFKNLADAGLFERVGQNIPSVFHATEVRKPFKIFRGAFEGNKNPSSKGSQFGNVSTGLSPDVGYHVVNEIPPPPRRLTVTDFENHPEFKRWSNNAASELIGAARLEKLAEAIQSRAKNTRDPFADWGQTEEEILSGIQRGLRRSYGESLPPKVQLEALLEEVYGTNAGLLKRQAQPADFNTLLKELLPWINTGRKRTIPLTLEPNQLLAVRHLENRKLDNATPLSPDEVEKILDDIGDDLGIRRQEIKDFKDYSMFGEQIGEPRFLDKIEDKLGEFNPDSPLYFRPLEDIMEISGYNPQLRFSELLSSKYNMPSTHTDGNDFDGDKSELAFNNIFTPVYSSITGQPLNRAAQQKIGRRGAAPLQEWWK